LYTTGPTADLPYDSLKYKPPLNSANVTPKDWVRIASDISKVYNQYDAFIIVHGVDTLAYTASVLSFMLENLAKPVILTDLKNLKVVLRVPNVPEVVVCTEQGTILRGCRTTRVGNKFVSHRYPALGRDCKINEKLILKPPTEKFNFLPIDPRNMIVVIKVFPGIVLKVGSETKGIVLETYDNGDIPTNKDFLEKLKTMIQEGVIVVSVSTGVAQGVSTSDDFKQIGVITGLDMTTEAALAKLHFLISNVSPRKKPVRGMFEKLLQFNMRGEVTPTDNASYRGGFEHPE
jgi:L-asparaginase